MLECKHIFLKSSASMPSLVPDSRVLLVQTRQAAGGGSAEFLPHKWESDTGFLTFGSASPSTSFCGHATSRCEHRPYCFPRSQINGFLKSKYACTYWDSTTAGESICFLKNLNPGVLYVSDSLASCIMIHYLDITSIIYVD